MGGEARAGLKMPIHAHLLRRTILTRNAGQVDLGFSERSRFISRSKVCACKTTSLRVQWLRFVPPWLTQNFVLFLGKYIYVPNLI